jgi:hypothetical protein
MLTIRTVSVKIIKVTTITNVAAVESQIFRQKLTSPALIERIMLTELSERILELV